MTSAYAVVDYDGSVLKAESRKNWPAAELIAELIPFSPSVVACDTNPPSKLARLLRTVFSARLWFPKRSLTHVEKAELARKIRHRNNHERDALAAALKAYRGMAGKLRQVKRRAGLRDVEVEKALRAVLAGRKLSDLAPGTLAKAPALEARGAPKAQRPA